MKKTLLSLILIAFGQLVHAQEGSENSIDPELDNRITKIEHELEKSSKFKISGYVQAQYQLADSAGIATFAGSNFAPGVDKRFSIRRGRLKATYQNNNAEGINITEGVFQIDATEGGVSLKEAYGKITDPYIHWVGLKVGLMDRPFGFEVGYSSSSLESPERARLFQTICPGETDLGAQLIIAPPKTSPLAFFKLETGLYNGTGQKAVDFDSKKDWISHLTFFKSNHAQTIKYSGGVSYFNGGNVNGTKKLYEIGTLSSGSKYWMLTDSSASNATAFAKRNFFGLDAQVSMDWAAGLTTLRGEFVSGTQAGTASTSITPSALPTTNTYTRQFNGAYFMLIQNIMKSKHNIVVKYDWYNPNTQVTKSDIGATGSNLTSTDMRYTTIGLGYYFSYDANWKFTAYYDIVKNEATNLAGFGSDLKDNVLTLRVQYKF